MAQPKKKKKKKGQETACFKNPSTSRVMHGHVPCFQKSPLSCTTFSEEQRPECCVGPQPGAGRCRCRLVGSWFMGKIKWSFPVLIFMAPTSLSWVVVGALPATGTCHVSTPPSGCSSEKDDCLTPSSSFRVYWRWYVKLALACANFKKFTPKSIEEKNIFFPS